MNNFTLLSCCHTQVTESTQTHIDSSCTGLCHRLLHTSSSVYYVNIVHQHDNFVFNIMFTESRGHHKKKKVHKEIKKIILKLIIAKFLLLIKIKMLLGMLQSIVLTKFIFTATILVMALVFKIWFEIKHAKLHHKEHDKSIIYYDNVHDHHTYELPEHDIGSHEEPDHSLSSTWGSLWGRSYAPTQMPAITSSPAFQSAYRKPWPYYVRPTKDMDPDEFS